MKNLLVPTDFSVNAKNALKYAIAFAKKEKNVKIILLHVFYHKDFSADVSVEFSPEETDRPHAIKSMNRLCEKINQEKLDHECITREGYVVDVILDIIHEKQIDLVIMGTKGALGLKEIFIGSNAERVIEKAPCPVVAVPKKAGFKDLKNITYVTDYYAGDISTMMQLVNVAKIFSAQINVLSMYDEEFMAKEENEFMKKFIQKVKAKTDYRKISYQLLYGPREEQLLEEYMSKTSGDLLVVSRNYRTLFEKLFGKNITKKLAYHRSMPLLVFHEDAKEITVEKETLKTAFHLI